MLTLQPSVDDLNVIIANYFPAAQNTKEKRRPERGPLPEASGGLAAWDGLGKNTLTLLHYKPAAAQDWAVLGTANEPHTPVGFAGGTQGKESRVG